MFSFFLFSRYIEIRAFTFRAYTDVLLAGNPFMPTTFTFILDNFNCNFHSITSLCKYNLYKELCQAYNDAIHPTTKVMGFLARKGDEHAR